MNDWIGRECSFGFMSGEPVWVDGIFLGIKTLVVEDEVIRILLGVRSPKSETWIDADAFIGIELKTPRQKLREYKSKEPTTDGES